MTGALGMLEFPVVALAAGVLPALGFQSLDDICAFHGVYFCANQTTLQGVAEDQFSPWLSAPRVSNCSPQVYPPSPMSWRTSTSSHPVSSTSRFQP